MAARLVVNTQRPSFSARSYVPLLVHLTNDANRDGRYDDSEMASSGNADVSFQVRVENVGSSPLTVVAIRDVSPTPMGSSAPRCGDLIGTRLGPGQSSTCRFTAAGFSPPGGERVVTVFEVDVANPAGSSTATVTDTTLLGTENAKVLGLSIRQLASTGARIAIFLLAAAVLAAVGLLLRRLGKARSGSDPARHPALGGRDASSTGGVHPRVRVRSRSRTRMGPVSGSHPAVDRSARLASSRPGDPGRAGPRVHRPT